MAGKIQAGYTTAKVLYAIVRNDLGQVWQTTTSTFVAYVSANLANYAIVMTEQGTASCHYTADFPAAAAGVYSVSAFVRVGGAPAESDGPDIASGNIEWDGSAIVPLSSRVKPADTVARVTLVDAVSGQLTAAQIATGIFQDTTAGDFLVDGSIGKLFNDQLNASVGSRSSLTIADIRTALGMASANLDVQLAALDADILTRLATASYTTPPTTAAIATAVLTTQMTESYAADGAAPTLAQAVFLTQQRLTEFTITGASIVVKKLDGTTQAAVLTMDSATFPTSSTRSA